MPSHEIQEFRAFIARLREAKSQVLLEPEMGLVEQFVLLEGEPKSQLLRENLDRFVGGGLDVIDRLCREAKTLGFSSVSAGLYKLVTQLRELFRSQFNAYPEGMSPQLNILRELMLTMSDGDLAKLDAQIAKHLRDLDGWFFLILGETMRSARSKGLPVNVKALLFLGGQVARARLKATLPCSFAYLYTAT